MFFPFLLTVSLSDPLLGQGAPSTPLIMKRVSAKSPGRNFATRCCHREGRDFLSFSLYGDLFHFACFVIAALRAESADIGNTGVLLALILPRNGDYFLLVIFTRFWLISQARMQLMHFCNIAKVACLPFFHEICIFTANKP